MLFSKKTHQFNLSNRFKSFYLIIKQMADFSCPTFKDTRSEKKRSDLKKEKWDRSIKENNGVVVEKKSVKKLPAKKEPTLEKTDSDIDDVDAEKTKTTDTLYKENLVANPINFHRRARSESPPPKSKRSNDGINRGKPSACSHCRPEIHARMYDASVVRSEIRQLNSADPQIDSSTELADQSDSN